MKAAQVEEIQGLYGPFSLSERVLQGIWARGDYHGTSLKTASGRSLRVLHPGRWNFQEGPDFKEAKLEIGGQIFCGDVEIHFKPEDWLAHGHQENPNFERVILHVVLQSGVGRELGCQTRRGHRPELLELLPLLNRDLEAYAMDEALIDLERVNELAWVDAFLDLSLAARLERLEAAARWRWAEKLRFATRRLAGSDWQMACHTAVLEVLGYARNRAPMHRIALEYSLGDFAVGLDVERVFEASQGKWRLQGLRPANHPRRRLLQYRSMCAARPDWPARLKAVLDEAPAGHAAVGTRDFRCRADLAGLRGRLADEVFSGQLGGTRLDTLLCDAVFPLAAASGLGGMEDYWTHWYPGDFPPKLSQFLKDTELVSPVSPRSNGRCQGALALFLGEGIVPNIG